MFVLGESGTAGAGRATDHSALADFTSEILFQHKTRISRETICLIAKTSSA